MPYVVLHSRTTCPRAGLPPRIMFHRLLLLLVGALVGVPGTAIAQERTREGDWWRSKDPTTDLLIFTREMRVPAVSPPRPALEVRFIPDKYERVAGNSALFYLKATGFFEQTIARQKVNEFYQAAAEKANATDVSTNQVAPWVWLNTRPSELPIDEMKEFLALTSFQPQFLKEATTRLEFSMDRNIGAVENPIGYLLPEIQQFRSTARLQSMRTRLAMAEGRIDDAIEIIGQQFAMANHLCQDDFLVSGLVGIAIHGMAYEDALYLAEQANAPNLYWAYAMLDHNLVDMDGAYAFERNVFYEQLKVLKEVGVEPRSVGYWNDFIDRLLPQLAGLAIEGLAVVDENESPEIQRIKLVGLIGASYPAARRYLIEEEAMDEAMVDAYPVTQVVMLAVCKFHDFIRDEVWKWKSLPYDSAISADGFVKADRLMDSQVKRHGFFTGPATLFTPAMNAVVRAENRAYEKMAMAQTVAAIQAFAAENDGRLPTTLDKLALPAPMDPATGRPLDYEVAGGKAILTGSGTNPRYRLIVEIAN